ncbi:hypothetical protein [Sphingomonas xinjiangensis]|uniref:Uncharacterized protein n=1 Tax=Sphingomonas xinjiangensis TaxID=643568 RepID=A0A840YH69_9SPHN|nr:hypothetical protein [Sphingomonas xinjiangensis]MBB5712234.1 hypothetical protein [Sphingomonas xinjiangensis]
MKRIVSLGLGLSLAAAGPAAATPVHSHSASVEHRSGPVRADYRGTVVIEHKQVGSVAPPGRASTLRCAWSARLEVDRVATTAAGAQASRSFATPEVARGSRTGWCGTSRDAIARAVAAGLRDAERHLAAAARDDRPALLSQVDRLADPA